MAHPNESPNGNPLEKQPSKNVVVQLLAFYVGAWCVGLIWLILGNVDLWTWLLLLGGGGVLCLGSVYCLWLGQKQSDLAKSGAAASSNSPTYEKGRLFALASLLTILLITGAGYFTSQSIPPSKALMLIARLEQAIKGYTEASAQPNDVEAFIDRGNALHEQGNFEAAIKDYTQAIALKPNYAEAFHNRGLSLYQQRKLEEAIKDFDKAIAFKPDYAGAFNNRGIALSDQGKLEEAIKDYTQAIALKPDDAKLFNNRGNALSKQGKFEEAIKDYSKAIALKPDEAAAFYNRGNDLSKQSKFEEAIKDYTQAIALKPDLALAFYNRGLAHYQQSKFEEAVKDYTQAIALRPNYWQAMYNNGLVQYERGEIDKAKTHWLQTVSFNEKATEPRLALAVALYTQGDKVKGIEFAKEALAIDKRYASLEYLKKQLWGNKLLADAAKLLAEL